MNGSKIEQCRQKLLSLRAELLALEGSSREATQPAELEQAAMDRVSRRASMQAQQKAEEGPRLRKRQLQKIEGALRRIEAGEYGKCFVCEEELDARGLSVDPTTTRCENCVEE
jgi:RNA polymerase-binding transcription factor